MQSAPSLLRSSRRRAAFLIGMAGLLLCMLSTYSAQTSAQEFTQPDPAPGPITECTPTGADLTGSFGANPCTWTRDNVPLDFAQNHQAGWYFMDYIQRWWNTEMLPAMKKMTAQLNAGTVDQTRQLGSMIDTHATASTGLMLQQKEYEDKKNLAPSEMTCAAATPMGSMARTSTVANELAQGYTNDITSRSMGAPGQPSARGPAADQKARMDIFCSNFLDPKSNAGQNPCPNPSTAGALPNGDIDVEGFLFRDTIDPRDPAQSAAAAAMLANLIQPRVDDRLPDNMVDTPQGQQWILQKEHIQSVRNVSTSIVASIISRRTAITGTNVGTDIRAIRTRIGIPASRISNDPSYNEIMQAMTKERFFDPAYYTKAAASLGTIRQEQTMVNAYTALQMQDIYKLQEQINALLAARAAIKLNAQPLPNRGEAAPAR